MPRSDGTLRDSEIVDYLSQRAYVECTDMGNDDPDQFVYPGSGSGTFRQAISQHITAIKARKGNA